MNFQKLLEDEINKIKDNKVKPKLLLHACCGPCSSYVIEYLSKYFDITIYYYNPNTYPETEYFRRLEELQKFIISFNNDVKIVEEKYNPSEFYTAIKGLEHLGERTERCYKCYNLRMKKSAIYAKENNYDYFTTTLSISPYKDAKWINEIGINLEKAIGIKYLYADFKKNNGYKRSIELSKKYKLYRQEYCGCVYSKNERETK